MIPRPAFAVALLLGACSAAAPTPPEDPGIAACRAEARSSPELRQVGRETLMGNSTNALRIDAQRAEVEGRALSDCLRRRGLMRGGGVEPVRRPTMF